MASVAQWVEGARPRTLPLAVAPVALGTGAAAALGAAVAGRALLALVVSLALQVGVNYANDYSDGIRGTDDERVGPLRLTGSRLAAPGQVKAAAFAAFGVAAVAGLALVAWSGMWWLLAVGAAAVASAWFYTGGPRPYGYAGLGELFVFVFFGLVAVLGTTITQAGRISTAAVAGAVGAGALACAVLVVNNLRDLPTDGPAGKRTLAVRLGDAATRRFFALLVLSAAPCALVAGLQRPGALLALLAGPLAVEPLRQVLGGAGGRGLLPALRDTGRLGLAYGVLFGAGLALPLGGLLG